MTLGFGSRIMYNVTIKAHRQPYFGKLGDMQLHRLEHLNFGSFQSPFFFFYRVWEFARPPCASLSIPVDWGCF